MHTRLLIARSSLVLAALTSAVLLAPSAARSEVLYKLDTVCSLNETAPVPCRVEAVNDGTATLYRHRIGQVIETIRVTENPVRMDRWIAATKQWQPLQRAEARFSTNTICFNGRELCVVNPNYLNSVRENKADAMTGRDLVKVHFGPDGRVNASCYDAGCDLVLK